MIVVGAGAAGLMAATEAALRGRRVVLLEKNRHPGLKILISGGGRCNLTTTLTGGALEQEYGERRGRWLRHALRAFPPTALRSLVESLGVALREEDLDKVFPVSGRARDVLDALLRRARDAGVTRIDAAPLLEIARSDDGFIVATPHGAVRATSVVVATGGLSYPKTGATGDGYAVARRFDHTLVPTVPHLAPLLVDVPWVRELQGIVVDARLTLRDVAGAAVAVRRRPTLFTHRGLSGPAPMDLSGCVEERGGHCTLDIDLAPDLAQARIEQHLVDAARANGRRLLAALLPLHVPERLRQRVAELSGAAATSGAGLTRAQRQGAASVLKALRVPVERSLGFGAAEVTRGGVALDEVDARTMESRRQKGLFFCGEVLDVDGPIGGFNFQAAFATGRLAGLHA